LWFSLHDKSITVVVLLLLLYYCHQVLDGKDIHKFFEEVVLDGKDGMTRMLGLFLPFSLSGITVYYCYHLFVHDLWFLLVIK
jgi:hypothetical protein